MSTTPLIHASGKVLAALDGSVHAAAVADHAAWAAARLGSELTLLHTLERASAPPSDLSGNIGLGAKSALLEELATLDERRARLAQSHGRELLEQARLRTASTVPHPVTVLMRHGGLVDSLVELEPEVRLFVLGKRGEHATGAAMHLGSNLERVIRAVHRPVLVADAPFADVRRFLIAFDGSPTSRKCIEMVCASPLLKGIACDLLMVGADAGASREHLDWAASALRACAFEPRVHLLAGKPELVILDSVETLGADLLLMGAYGHSRIRQLIVGSVTTQVLRGCARPVLLLR